MFNSSIHLLASSSERERLTELTRLFAVNSYDQISFVSEAYSFKFVSFLKTSFYMFFS